MPPSSSGARLGGLEVTSVGEHRQYISLSWLGSIGAAEYSAAHQRSRDLAGKQAIWRHLCDRNYHIK